MPHDMIVSYFYLPFITSVIVLHFLQNTLLLSFYTRCHGIFCKEATVTMVCYHVSIVVDLKQIS